MSDKKAHLILKDMLEKSGIPFTHFTCLEYDYIQYPERPNSLISITTTEKDFKNGNLCVFNRRGRDKNFKFVKNDLYDNMVKNGVYKWGRRYIDAETAFKIIKNDYLNRT